MEKIEREFTSDDRGELDDVLDQSFFMEQDDDIDDLEEDEAYYEELSNDFRRISEL